jgi:hypothetical protein
MRTIGEVTQDQVQRFPPNNRGGGVPQPKPSPVANTSGSVRIPSGLIVPTEMIVRLKERRSQDFPQGQGGRHVTVYEDFRKAATPFDEQCPNCGGPKGSGLIYAPTGKLGAARYFGHYITRTRNNVDGEPVTSQEPEPIRRELEPFPCPVCAGDSRRMFMMERSGLLYEGRNWDEIDHRIYQIDGREQFEQMVNYAVGQWTSGNPTGWLTIIGPYGTGKTAVGEAIVKRCVMSNVQAIFVEAGKLFQVANDSFGNFDTDPQTVLSKWREAPVLVIDEIDWKNTRKYSGDMSRAAEEIFTMLNHRYRTQKATAIISPLDWWLIDMEGNLHLNPDQGSDWKAILSRGSEGWIALTQIADQRQTFGKSRRGEDEV